MKFVNLFTHRAVAMAAMAALAGPAFAAINLDAHTPPLKYASEQNIVASPGTILMPMVNGSDLTGYVSLGAAFAVDAVAYVRFDLSAGAFTMTPVGSVYGGGVTVTAVQGGMGTNYVIFALTPAPSTALPATATVAMEAAGGLTVTSQTTVNLNYRLYASLANASAMSGAMKTASSAFVAFMPALNITLVPAAVSPVADVSASGGPFTDFTTPSAYHNLGRVTVGLNNEIALQSGAWATIPDLLDDTSTLTATGDFSLAASDAPAGYDANARNRVLIKASSTCLAMGPTSGAATLSASSANFTAITAQQLTFGRSLCVQEEGTPAIQASPYSVTFHPVAKTGFTLNDQTASFTPILRNGSQVEVRTYVPVGTPGYTGAVRMINAGTMSAPVTGQWVYQDGTLGAAISLITLPAAGSETLSASQIEAILGAPTPIGGNRPRLRLISPSTSLQAQSFLLNPGGVVTTVHAAD